MTSSRKRGENSSSSGAAVKQMLDEFEYFKARRLAPTSSAPSPPVTTTGKSNSGVQRTQQEQQQQVREDLRRVELDVRRRMNLEEVAGRGGSGDARVVAIGEKAYVTFSKPMDHGPSAMVRWLLDLTELRKADLILALRERFALTALPTLADLQDAPSMSRWWSSVVPLTSLQKAWLQHCSKNPLLLMPNPAVAFTGFLRAALPDLYIDKRQAEQLYLLLNERRNSQLSFATAFTKLIVLLVHVDDSAEEDFAQLFFSMCRSVFQPHHFVSALDYQTIVSTFETLVNSEAPGSAGRECVIGSASAGLAGIFRQDIMNFAEAQPLRHHILLRDAAKLLDGTPLARYMDNGMHQLLQSFLTDEAGRLLASFHASRLEAHHALRHLSSFSQSL